MAKEKTELSGYELSRGFFDWSFANPDLVRPNHIALYFFCIEHNNRLGWKEKFGLPTTMTMEAIGIKSYNTYSSTFNDLVKWGFIKLVEKSRNQYSANVIGLSKFNKANNKALDKAFIKHGTKQKESTVQSTGESTSSIDKQENKEQGNNKQLTETEKKLIENLDEVQTYKIVKESVMMKNKLNEDQYQKVWLAFRLHVMTEGVMKSISELRSYVSNWVPKHKDEILSGSTKLKTAPVTKQGYGT